MDQVLARWWQLKYFWNFHRENCGMIQFDQQIFQIGWFNQPDQPVIIPYFQQMVVCISEISFSRSLFSGTTLVSGRVVTLVFEGCYLNLVLPIFFWPRRFHTHFPLASSELWPIKKSPQKGVRRNICFQIPWFVGSRFIDKIWGSKYNISTTLWIFCMWLLRTAVLHS